MTVNLNGFKVSELARSSGIPPSVSKIMSELDKTAFKELLTSDQVAALAGFALTIKLNHPALEPYRYKISHSRVFYGSKKTISELRKINS